MARAKLNVVRAIIAVGEASSLCPLGQKQSGDAYPTWEEHKSGLNATEVIRNAV